jgi:hypothetical protein
MKRVGEGFVEEPRAKRRYQQFKGEDLARLEAALVRWGRFGAVPRADREALCAALQVTPLRVQTWWHARVARAVKAAKAAKTAGEAEQRVREAVRPGAVLDAALAFLKERGKLPIVVEEDDATPRAASSAAAAAAPRAAIEAPSAAPRAVSAAPSAVIEAPSAALEAAIEAPSAAPRAVIEAPSAAPSAAIEAPRAAIEAPSAAPALPSAVIDSAMVPLVTGGPDVLALTAWARAEQGELAARVAALAALGRVAGEQAALLRLAHLWDEAAATLGRAARPVAWLRFGDGEWHAVTQGAVRIGRDAGSDWPLTDHRVSKRHAVLVASGARKAFILCQLGRHATRVGSVEIGFGQCVWLERGRVWQLRVGSTEVALRYAE